VRCEYTGAHMNELYCIVTGKVQGVRYRSYLEDAATKLGVTGYVRNLSNGSVEVCAQGEADVLKDFIEYINEGSLQAMVDGVDATWRNVRTTYYEFSVLH
jgi:acylphosphatase